MAEPDRHALAKPDRDHDSVPPVPNIAGGPNQAPPPASRKTQVRRCGKDQLNGLTGGHFADAFVENPDRIQRDSLLMPTVSMSKTGKTTLVDYERPSILAWHVLCMMRAKDPIVVRVKPSRKWAVPLITPNAEMDSTDARSRTLGGDHSQVVAKPEAAPKKPASS